MNDRYLHLSTEELAAEPAVRAYLRRGERAGAWTPWLEAHPAARERVAEVRDILALLEAQPGAGGDPPEVDALWQRIAAATEPRRARRPTRRRLRRFALGAGLAAAAAVALLLLYVAGAQPDYRTGPRQHLTVVLPDSSTVALAPESELSVRDYGDRRTVELVGEAFFEVRRGRPFRVETAAGHVAVLGTSFEVYAPAGRLDVACATGRVRVVAAAGESGVELAPGQRATLRSGRLRPSASVTPAEIAAWRYGRLHFASTPLTTIAERLARHYDRPFEVVGAARERVLTAALPTRDLREVAQQISFLTGAPVDTTGAAVRIGG